MQTSHTKMNHHEHTVPLFWPFAAAMELGKEGMKLFQDNVSFLNAAALNAAPQSPAWATPNRVRLDLDTMLLRDFSSHQSTAIPILIDAPYAGHNATIADYAKGQSLVETLLGNGCQRVFVTDWKPATDAMKQFDIDKYLAEINVVVDDLGGVVHLVGLCQGGWMGAMYAARFPSKVRSLVLAGSPIDTQAGDGPLKKMVHTLPSSFYQELVRLGNGRMLGRAMLAGWKGMNPDQQYLEKYLDLYNHIEEKNYVTHNENFERWYENPIDLPSTFYLQAIELLFEQNLFFNKKFVGLGKHLSLRDIDCPAYLLAGESDEITPKEQVFAAEHQLGTAADKIIKDIAPGGHIGLFMGTKTLKEYWPKIARWILLQEGLNSF